MSMNTITGRTVTKHGYATYPRRFRAYQWYKPLIVGVLIGVFTLVFSLAVDLAGKGLFGSVDASAGYDDMDFFTAAGAFSNGAQAAVPILCLILAALIVKDRPVSSYFSSMGGWRWKVFLKIFAVFFVILGVPTIVSRLVSGRTGDIQFTLGGFIILALFVPLQGVGEELIFRGYIMQTVSSWFRMAAAGVIVQILVFTVVHPYNIVGIIEIAVSALLYALICIVSKGIEAPSAMHILNNATEIFLVGFGFGKISAEQTVPSVVLNLLLKTLCFLFVLFVNKKLHWFDKVKYDDVAAFNARGMKRVS